MIRRGEAVVVWNEARSALERHFGYNAYRPGQGEAIQSVLAGHDTLVVMPTGGGKSLCYQVPALVLPGLTLVVSPLIALMLDQVARLRERGVPAALVNSTLSSSEIDERLERAVSGDLKLLYVAPERFRSEAFRRTLRRMNVGLVAVDEAHCVSEWGHDFRPSYLQLRDVWAEIGRPRILALTATATPEVRRDIVRELNLRHPRVMVRGFDRPNLHWRVIREDKLAEKSRRLIDLLGSERESAVVYASTRKMVEAVAELLRTAGIDATAYHAGLPRDRRARAQADWTSGAASVVVATNAFGMGIDKEDVRRVVHFQMPGSLEAYYQEAGRAGRDGRRAECVLLHSYGDRFIHEFFIRSSYPSRKVVVSVYRAVCKVAEALGGPVSTAELAHRVQGAKSNGEVISALRILCDSGALEDTRTRRGCLVRWVVPPAQLRNLIRHSDGFGLTDSTARALLEGLARASSQGERRVLSTSRGELARWAGGDFRAARTALDELQQVGLLGWRDDGERSGYLPVDASRQHDELPVAWDRISSLRALERRKLKRMETYAFQKGCRRRYLLRYFGEHAPQAHCGACDRCA